MEKHASRKMRPGARLNWSEGAAQIGNWRLEIENLQIFTSLGALVNPGAEQANLIGSQRLGRLEITGTTWTFCWGIVRATALRRRASGPSAAFAETAFGRHCGFVIDTGCGDDDQASLAVARFDNFAVVAAFEDPVAAIKAKAGFGAILAVATHA